VHVAAQQALNRGARAAIRHLVQLDAGRLLEQHGSEMERIANAGVGELRGGALHWNYCADRNDRGQHRRSK
jgi:hypothetical protein